MSTFYVRLYHLDAPVDVSSTSRFAYVTITILREILSDVAFTNNVDMTTVKHVNYITTATYIIIMTSPGVNLTAYTWHFNNIPFGFCHKDNLLKPALQHNMRRKALCC